MESVNWLQAAYLVADYLTVRTEGKKHGSYNIFEDDKVLIYRDTYVPNLDVYVKFPEGKKCVLYHNGNGYHQEYHSGEWEAYLVSLAPKALEAKQKHERELIRIRREEWEQKFTPADDSVVFGGSKP